VLFRTIDFGWFTPLALQKACEGEEYGKMKKIGMWNGVFIKIDARIRSERPCVFTDRGI
jgi:hypothetical protein